MDKADDSKSLVRGLTQLDATTIVVGSMIGSGIFIVSSESARLLGAPGWLLLAWLLAGTITITGAICFSELAAMMPRAGGPYVFLTEAYGRPIGFLYGWSQFLIVQSGTIAAVAVAFANFTGILFPVALFDELHYRTGHFRLVRDRTLHLAASRHRQHRPSDVHKHAGTAARKMDPKQLYTDKNGCTFGPDHNWPAVRMEFRRSVVFSRPLEQHGKRLDAR